MSGVYGSGFWWVGLEEIWLDCRDVSGIINIRINLEKGQFALCGKGEGVLWQRPWFAKDVDTLNQLNSKEAMRNLLVSATGTRREQVCRMYGSGRNPINGLRIFPGR